MEKVYKRGGIAFIRLPEGASASVRGGFFAEKSGLPVRAREIFIPEGVTAIASGAFRSCKELIRVYLPSTLTSVGTAPFEDCAALNEVVFFGDSAEWKRMTKAKTEKVLKYVAGQYDRYPYYSDHGSTYEECTVTTLPLRGFSGFVYCTVDRIRIKYRGGSPQLTEPVTEDKRQMLEDALNAVKAAMK